MVLSRKKGEKIVIDGVITVEVVEVKGDRVKLGFTAPKDVEIHRHEVWVVIHGNDEPPPDNNDAGKEAA